MSTLQLMKRIALTLSLLTALASCAPTAQKTQKAFAEEPTLLAVGQRWKYEGTVSRTFDITDGNFNQEGGIAGVMLSADSQSPFMTAVRVGSFADGPRQISIVNVSGDQSINTLCVLPYPVKGTALVLTGFEFLDTPDLNEVTTHYLKTGEHPTTDKACRLTRLQ